MFGAVECQKVSGALHFHFWVYVQRLHQMKTLKEIATFLQAKLCNVETFKQFVGNLRREDYPDLPSFTQQIHAVERCWPRYTEKDEAAQEYSLCNASATYVYVEVASRTHSRLRPCS